ncbi:MAG: hypothetical protein V7637_3890 [Mycobacteriales bacterium]|jgi:uncharacterized protein YbjT (DUF2867 family)
MKIAVAGGTGLVGRLIVDAVRAGGNAPVVLARSTGADVTTGAGLDEALRGVSTVIDVSNVTTLSRRTAIAFFEAATRNLLAAGRRAGVTHHVVLSIVGIDRVAMGYYLGKRRQEELALSGPVPGTVLRATQFHEFAAQLLARGGPFVLVPKAVYQPVAAAEVASAVLELALGPAVGMAPELAGPEPHAMPDLVRRLARARGSRRPVVAVRLPGAAGRALRAGGLLPTAPGPRGTRTFAQWLAAGAVTSPPAEPGRP